MENQQNTLKFHKQNDDIRMRHFENFDTEFITMSFTVTHKESYRTLQWFVLVDG